MLEGTFSDESGDYAAGTYVRNPPGSSHAPSSSNGCVIFVKLCQMPDSESRYTVVDTESQPWQSGPVVGVESKPLYQSDRECVSLPRIAPGSCYRLVAS